MTEFYYKIVYSRGNSDTLAVAMLQTNMRYEEDDYVIASDREFDNEEEANEHCRYLANKHGKKTKGLPLPKLT